MKIGIIGAKGFIGSEISHRLQKYEIYPIGKEGWAKQYYDLIIDADGSSKKYLAEDEPLKDFKASVDSVIYHTNALDYDKYIYLSTIDVEYYQESNYGFHRKIAEDLIKKYCSNFTIIRLCSVIGHSAIKGVVRDILYHDKIYTKKSSTIQLISLKEVVSNILLIINERDTDHKILKFYGTEPIRVERICSMFGKNPVVHRDSKLETYNSIPSNMGFKTSEQYLKETFHERMV